MMLDSTFINNRENVSTYDFPTIAGYVSQNQPTDHVCDGTFYFQFQIANTESRLIDELRTLGRQARDQLVRYLIAVPEVAPRWAVTEDDDAAVARVAAFSRPVAKRVDKEQRVAGVHVDLDRALDVINRRDLAAHSVSIGVGVREVGFVAAGHDHCGAIARPDIRQRHQDVDLPAMKHAVVEAELGALCALVAAGMQPDRLAGSPYIGKALVDEERAMIVVKGIGAADEELDLFDPGGMINETLEGFAALVNLLQVQAVVVAEVVAVHITLPFAVPDRQQRVDGGVDIGDFAG